MIEIDHNRNRKTAKKGTIEDIWIDYIKTDEWLDGWMDGMVISGYLSAKSALWC